MRFQHARQVIGIRGRGQDDENALAGRIAGTGRRLSALKEGRFYGRFIGHGRNRDGANVGVVNDGEGRWDQHLVSNDRGEVGVPSRRRSARGSILENANRVAREGSGTECEVG